MLNPYVDCMLTVRSLSRSTFSRPTRGTSPAERFSLKTTIRSSGIFNAPPVGRPPDRVGKWREGEEVVVGVDKIKIKKRSARAEKNIAVGKSLFLSGLSAFLKRPPPLRSADHKAIGRIVSQTLSMFGWFPCLVRVDCDSQRTINKPTPHRLPHTNAAIWDCQTLYFK